ncbi:unnamed protein product [Periconia digitata]|uniref:Uncharacterized protein n=1 Tax=Periconia digitata TaxID=1303443 RepID=A0A9W4UPR1_9PLEO|nr:unnamed protein product [Periconia digitata]
MGEGPLSRSLLDTPVHYKYAVPTRCTYRPDHSRHPTSFLSSKYYTVPTYCQSHRRSCQTSPIRTTEMCLCTQYDSHCGHSWVSQTTPCGYLRDFLNCSQRQIVQMCIAPPGTCPQCFAGFANPENIEMIQGPWGCNQMIRSHLGDAHVIPGHWGNINLQPQLWGNDPMTIPGNWGPQPMMGNGWGDQRLTGPGGPVPSIMAGHGGMFYDDYGDGGPLFYEDDRRRRHRRDEYHIRKYKHSINHGGSCAVIPAPQNARHVKGTSFGPLALLCNSHYPTKTSISGFRISHQIYQSCNVVLFARTVYLARFPGTRSLFHAGQYKNVTLTRVNPFCTYSPSTSLTLAFLHQYFAPKNYFQNQRTMAAVAGFLENLFNSIFTPGPTPTLLVATNASFAALQLLFAALLFATYSIHFVILSVLCGGLWWAINWFAGEIRELQAKDAEAKRAKEAKRDKDGVRDEDGMDSGDDTEVDTEVEQTSKAKAKSKATHSQSQGLGKKPSLKSSTKASRAPKPETQSTVFVEKPSEAEYPGAGRGREATPIQSSSGPAGVSTTGASTRLEPLVDDALKKRKSLGESTGELSTDSEWEKLSQDSGER